MVKLDRRYKELHKRHKKLVDFIVAIDDNIPTIPIKIWNEVRKDRKSATKVFQSTIQVLKQTLLEVSNEPNK